MELVNVQCADVCVWVWASSDVSFYVYMVVTSLL